MAEQEIFQLLISDKDIQCILEIIQELNLKDSWLCAGSIRNFMWHVLSGRTPFDQETDVDVIFYDEKISYEETLKIEAKLRQDYPQYQWELKNQVYMHIHSPDTSPYQDARDAMAKFPETCTAIGLRRDRDGKFEWFTPYGIEDILHFSLRPTPHFSDNPARYQLYQERIKKKNWHKKWPQLKKYQ